MSRHTGGFTLIEAVVALTLSSVVVVLVSTVFLVQNQYYAIQKERSAVHENARVMTDVMATDIRSLLDGGFMLASGTYMVMRVPRAMAAVCASAGGTLSVHVDGGVGGLDPGELHGFAQRLTPGGDWQYFVAPWSSIYLDTGTPAADCAAAGADTVGISDEFLQLANLSTYSGVNPPVGDMIALFSLVGYSIGTSVLDSTQVGLFRTIGNTTSVEFATGLQSSAGFQYRTGGSYSSTVTGSSLSDIDAVRLAAEARKPPVTGGRDDVTFGWDVNVYLRNRR